MRQAITPACLIFFSRGLFRRFLISWGSTPKAPEANVQKLVYHRNLSSHD